MSMSVSLSALSDDGVLEGYGILDGHDGRPKMKTCVLRRGW